MLLTLTTDAERQSGLLNALGVTTGGMRTVQLPSGTATLFLSSASQTESAVSVLVEASRVAGGRRGSSAEQAPYPAPGPGHAAITVLEACEGLLPAEDDGEVIPLRLTVPGVACDGPWARKLLEPLGYEVALRPADTGGIGTLLVSARTTVPRLLRHVCALLPALDDGLGLTIDSAGLAALADRVRRWLDGHPLLDLVLSRYASPPPLPTRQSLAPLLEEDLLDLDASMVSADAVEASADRAMGAEPARQAAILDLLRTNSARRVALFGIGDGVLVHRLAGDPDVDLLTIADPSTEALARVAGYVSPDTIGHHVILIQSSPLYRDERLQGCDAIILREVIEHTHPERLRTLERCVLEAAAPRMVIVTTPNADLNPRWPSLCANGRRHPDHRFEWGREAFSRWAQRLAGQTGCVAEVVPVGPEDAELGAPTLMGVFRRAG